MSEEFTPETLRVRAHILRWQVHDEESALDLYAHADAWEALERERWDDFSKDDPQSWPLYVHEWLARELSETKAKLATEVAAHQMTDIRDAEPHPPDDSGGYCCVAAGMHMGHDENCPTFLEKQPEWLGIYATEADHRLEHDKALRLMAAARELGMLRKRLLETERRMGVTSNE